MKKILFIISMLIGVAYGQSVGYFRYDTTVLQKIGGNNELKIMNATRGVTGGVLTNMGNGRTAFVTPGGGGGSLSSVGSGTTLKGTGDLDIKSLTPGWNLNFLSTSTDITIESRDTLYIVVSGQSNSNGFNNGNYDVTPNPKVLGWNGSAWVMLQRGVPPMGWCEPGVMNSVGCGGSPTVEDSATAAYFYLAKRLQERTGKVIKVIVTGWQGRPITDWLPESSTRFGTIKTYMAAVGNPHIDYFIWQQGESDFGTGDVVYKTAVDSLTAQLDRQPFFGKDVPMFITTVRDTSIYAAIYNIQFALGSGLYDKRWTVIDAGKAGYYTPNPVHFSAQGQYDIAKAIMQKIYDPAQVSNTFRQTSATQRADILQWTPTIAKGIIHIDSVTKATYITDLPIVQTAIANGQLTLKQTGDAYGGSMLKIQNSGAVVGAYLSNTGVDATNLGFGTNSGAEAYLQFEHRGGASMIAGNTNGEFQFFKSGQFFAVGQSFAAIQGKTYIGSAVVPASHTLTVADNIRIAAISNVGTPDSALYIEDGVIKAGSTIPDVTIPINNLLAATGSNTIDNGNHAQEWQWNTLSGLTGLKLTSTSTAASGDAATLLFMSLSGVNAGSGQTTYGIRLQNTHTGTSAENYGMLITASGASNLANIAVSGQASGGTTNIGGQFTATGGYAIIVPASGGDVGMGTSTPTSGLHVNNSFATAYAAKTTTYPITALDHTLEATSGTFTMTLPTAVGITGRQYVITNSGSGVLTLATTSSQTFINVTATPITLTLNQFSTVTVVSNGANWLRTSSL